MEHADRLTTSQYVHILWVLPKEIQLLKRCLEW